MSLYKCIHEIELEELEHTFSNKIIEKGDRFKFIRLKVDIPRKQNLVILEKEYTYYTITIPMEVFNFAFTHDFDIERR